MNNQIEHKSRVGAVLVTYHPDPVTIENIAAAAAQVQHLVIVDNGSDQAFWQELSHQKPDVQFQLISHPENVGIAEAFNIGARVLLAANVDFVITLDQDSALPEHYVSQMIAGFAEAQKVFGQVGVFGTYFQDKNSGLVFPNHFTATTDYINVESTISSGNLIPATTFAQIGFFRDDFFIDAVDTEFHLRANSAGLPLVLTRKIILPHCLGEQSITRLLWFYIPITSHNYIRRYYIARNRVLTYKLYAKKFPAWFRLELRMFLGDFLTMMFYDSDKIRKLKYTFKGIRDGLQGKTGAFKS